MADSNAAPLTDEERAELEELRAEKTRREEAERARRERAELERLRADKEKAEAQQKQPAAKVSTKRAAEGESSAKATSKSKPRPEAARSAKASAKGDAPQSFGVRMVTSAPTAEDEIPGMPPAQKLIIILAVIAVVIFAGYIALSNAGLI